MTIGVNRLEASRVRESIAQWVEDTDCFVMALVDGVFWKAADPIPFERFLTGLLAGDEELGRLIEAKKQRALKLVEGALAGGAHGIMIGDDLAHDGGPFASPDLLASHVFSALTELAIRIKEGGARAFLHCCGKVDLLLPLIMETPFEALHGLSSRAGNDLVKLRRRCSGRLALMGGVDLDHEDPNEIRRLRREVLEPLGRSGGYIMGSSAGLWAKTPVAAVKALYGLSES